MHINFYTIKGLCLGMTAEFFTLEQDEEGNQTVVNDIRIFLIFVTIQILY